MAHDLPDGIDIRCCDCLSAEGLPSIPDGSVDLTVTSPPYDNLRQYGGYTFDFERTAQELWRVTKPGGVVVWVVGDATVNGSETGTAFRQALRFMEIGFNLHDTMIYYKDSCPFPETNRYYPVFEYMFVLSRGTPKTANLLKDKPNRNIGSRIASSSERQPDGTLIKASASRTNPSRVVQEYGVRGNVWLHSAGWKKSTEDDFAFAHPAIFPEALARDHILSWSNPGDLVLDPMVGSGTTAKMAYVYGRRFIGFDCNPAYVEIAKRRLAQQRLVL